MEYQSNRYWHKYYDPGGRLKRLEDYLRHDTFLLTYGDGVSDIDLNKLVKFHFKNKKIGNFKCS